MKRAVLSLALLLISSSLSAQENPCLRRVLPVSVFAADGGPVRGLTAENFRGSFRGAPVQIISVNSVARPIRLVILLDLSANMQHVGRGERNVTVEKFVLQTFLTAANPRQVALISLESKTHLRPGLREDKQAVLNVLRDLELTGATLERGRKRLWDAIREAFNLLTPHQPGDVIYAITDGANIGSHQQESETVEAMLRSRIRFFAFLFPFDDLTGQNTRNDLYVQQEWAKLAAKTGGNVFYLERGTSYWPALHYEMSEKEKKQVSEATGALDKQMQEFYLLEISLPQAVDKPRSWKLELVPAGERQVKGLNLRFQQELLPCSTAKGAQPPAPK